MGNTVCIQCCKSEGTSTPTSDSIVNSASQSISTLLGSAPKKNQVSHFSNTVTNDESTDLDNESSPSRDGFIMQKSGKSKKSQKSVGHGNGTKSKMKYVVSEPDISHRRKNSGQSEEVSVSGHRATDKSASRHSKTSTRHPGAESSPPRPAYARRFSWDVEGSMEAELTNTFLQGKSPGRGLTKGHVSRTRLSREQAEVSPVDETRPSDYSKSPGQHATKQAPLRARFMKKHLDEHGSTTPPLEDKTFVGVPRRKGSGAGYSPPNGRSADNLNPIALYNALSNGQNQPSANGKGRRKTSDASAFPPKPTAPHKSDRSRSASCEHQNIASQAAAEFEMMQKQKRTTPTISEAEEMATIDRQRSHSYDISKLEARNWQKQFLKSNDAAPSVFDYRDDAGKHAKKRITLEELNRTAKELPGARFH